MLPAVDVLGSVLKIRLPAQIASFILTSCAAKLPVPSRSTMVFGVLRFVAVSEVVPNFPVESIETNAVPAPVDAPEIPWMKQAVCDVPIRVVVASAAEAAFALI